MKKTLIILLLFTIASFGQGNFYTFDMTEILAPMEKPWSVGNGINEPYFEVNVFGDMDMNGQELEIMNCKIHVFGDTLNSGTVTKRFFGISEMIVEGSTLNVPTPEIEYYLQLYPNPASTYFFVTTNKESSLNVYDIHGRIVLKTLKDSKVFRFDVNLSSGIYFVEIRNIDNQKLVKRLIIK